MGLLSNYIAYRYGKRRERKTWEAYRAEEELRPVDRECIHYSSLCGPRGACPRHLIYQCVYDEE